MNNEKSGRETVAGIASSPVVELLAEKMAAEIRDMGLPAPVDVVVTALALYKVFYGGYERRDHAKDPGTNDDQRQAWCQDFEDSLAELARKGKVEA